MFAKTVSLLLVGRFGRRLARSWWWPRALKTTPVEKKQLVLLVADGTVKWWNVLFGEWPQTSEVGNWISLVQLAMPFSMRIVWFVVNNFPCLSFDSSKVSFCWAQRGRCKVAGMILGLYWCFLGLQSLSFRSFRHSLTCWVHKEFLRWEKFVFKEIWADQKWTCLNMHQKVWQGKKMLCVLCFVFHSTQQGRNLKKNFSGPRLTEMSVRSWLGLCMSMEESWGMESKTYDRS